MNGTHAQPPGSHYNDPTSFAGFTFNGNQNLDALAGFYGLATPVLASQVTLAQYLAQVCHGDVRPGFCISVGNAQLVVLDVEEGKRIAHAIGESKADILRNHGILTVGHTVDEAAWLYITMERTCEVQLLAEAVGTPTLIEPEMARLTRSQVGSHVAGWFSFQPLFDKIVAEQPDLLG